ncbi:MAG: DUF998 domain-containing protein [Candidatus Micrarchaeota archaeon]|nr:DUF998 domain-containing protein [Candidatus Micrarchaeota archaeon]
MPGKDNRIGKAEVAGHGSARVAGCLLALGTLQFIIVMAIVQAYFPCRASICYNTGTNPISDLGNTAMSPLWPLFNYSLIAFGIMFFAGLVLIMEGNPRRFAARLGILLMAISAFGAAGVGTVPENVILKLHSLFAAIAFFAGGLGILLFAISMMASRKNRAYAIYSLISGIVSVVVFLAFTAPLGLVPHLITSGSGIGFGAVERVIAGPILLWALVTGILLLKNGHGFDF